MQGSAELEATVAMWCGVWLHADGAAQRELLRARTERPGLERESLERVLVVAATNELAQAASRHAPSHAPALWLATVARTSQSALRALVEGIECGGGTKVVLRDGRLTATRGTGVDAVAVEDVGGVECLPEGEIAVCGWTRSLEHFRVRCDPDRVETVVLGVMAARGATCLAMERGLVPAARDLADARYSPLRRAAEAAATTEILRARESGGLVGGVRAMERWMREELEEESSFLTQLVMRWKFLSDISPRPPTASTLLFYLAGVCASSPPSTAAPPAHNSLARPRWSKRT